IAPGSPTVITVEGTHTIGVNAMVRVMRSLDSSRNLRGGRFHVSAVSGNTISIDAPSWTFGSTTGGTVRVDAVVYPNVDSANTAAGRIVTRRVGRPFFGYRGRRSKRR